MNYISKTLDPLLLHGFLGMGRTKTFHSSPKLNYKKSIVRLSLFFLAFAPTLVFAQLTDFKILQANHPELFKYVTVLNKKNHWANWSYTFAKPKYDRTICRPIKISDTESYDLFDSIVAIAWYDGGVFVKATTTNHREYLVLQLGVTASAWRPVWQEFNGTSTKAKLGSATAGLCKPLAYVMYWPNEEDPLKYQQVVQQLFGSD